MKLYITISEQIDRLQKAIEAMKGSANYMDEGLISTDPLKGNSLDEGQDSGYRMSLVKKAEKEWVALHKKEILELAVKNGEGELKKIKEMLNKERT